MKYAFQQLKKEHLVEKRALYVIKCLSFYKVGLAADLDARLRALQKGCPFPLQIVIRRNITRASAIWVERNVHKQLARWHTHGEWFEAPFNAVKAAVGRACTTLQDRLNRQAARTLAARHDLDTSSPRTPIFTGPMGRVTARVKGVRYRCATRPKPRLLRILAVFRQPGEACTGHDRIRNR